MATRRPSKGLATAVAPKPDFSTLLAAAQLPERSVPVCLRADLAADHEAADRELEQLVRNPPSSLGGDGRGELRDRIAALEAEMKASTYPFRLRALPKPKFRALVAAHPPRRGDDGEPDQRDAVIGLNAETFFDALIRACLLDPALDDAQWADLEAKLTDRQYDDLSNAAWYLNRSEVDVPFSRAASRQNLDSGSE